MNPRYLILFLALILLAIFYVIREDDHAANPGAHLMGHDHSHDHGGHYHGDGHDHSGEDLPDGPPTKSGSREDGGADGSKFTTTASGLQYRALYKGDGPTPKPSDQIVVLYEGSTEDGSIFDSNLNRGPSTFPLSRVISGWQEGLQLMPVGSRFRFIIPSDLAYGERGHPPLIPSGATLYFEIELLEIPAESPVSTETPAASDRETEPSGGAGE